MATADATTDTECKVCLAYTGLSRVHVGLCPIAPVLKCRRCNVHGHTAAQCDRAWPHWERPTSLEELIPPDVRARFNINSCTPIAYAEDRGDGNTAKEFRIEIKVPRNDKAMREFMAHNDIRTTHQTKENLTRIREWALQRGIRIRMV